MGPEPPADVQLEWARLAVERVLLAHISKEREAGHGPSGDELLEQLNDAWLDLFPKFFDLTGWVSYEGPTTRPRETATDERSRQRREGRS